MANTYKFMDMVAKEALAELHEQAAFLKTVDRQYDSSFGKEGAKIGSTLRIRKPNEFTVRTGNQMVIQQIEEQTDTLTLSTLKGVDMEFNHVDMKLNTASTKEVSEFNSRYIRPAILKLVSTIEAEGIRYATKNTADIVGTPGTAINSISVPQLMSARLDQHTAPMDERYTQIDSVSNATLITGLASLMNPQKDISRQYIKGSIGEMADSNFIKNNRIWTMQNSADVLGEINAGTLTSGITALTVDGLSAAPAEGMVFTVEGIYDIHPETKDAYPHLKQFVVTAGATTTNLTFSPAMIFDPANPRQNCSGTPADNNDITFVGAANSNYLQPLMYHRDAFQFVTTNLQLVDDADKCAVATEEGFSIRVWRQSDIYNNRAVIRLDVIYGFGALRKEWAVRGIGQANA